MYNTTILQKKYDSKAQFIMLREIPGRHASLTFVTGSGGGFIGTAVIFWRIVFAEKALKMQ